jgi:hypothetical protein
MACLPRWQLVRCQGLQLKLPEPIVMHYPDARHVNPTKWTRPDEHGVVFAQGQSKCSVFLLVDDANMDDAPYSCRACLKLEAEPTMQKLLENAHDDDLHKKPVKNSCLTRHQLVLRLNMHKNNGSKLRLFVFKQGQKLSRLNRTAADHKRMIQLLAQNDVPRVRQLMARMIDRNASATVIIRQIQLAIDGVYKPRILATSPEFEQALDDAELALILGGPRMLWALQRSHGELSKTTVLEHRPHLRFVTSWDESVYEQTVRINLDRFVLALPAPRTRKIYHLMLDDVAIESRRRVSPEDARMRGYGRENDFTGVALEVVSGLTLEALKAAETRELNPLRLGDELTVFAIGANRETEYAVSLVAASATCKKGALAADLRPAVTTILNSWKTCGAWDGRGPISTIAKDGASLMNQAVFPYVTEFEIDRASPVGVALFGEDGKGCTLFFVKCGHSPQWPIVDLCDDKHFVKRFRMAMKREGGIRIQSTCFDIWLVSRLLVETGKEPSQVKTWFGEGEEDAQNVPACMSLLLAVAEFRNATHNSFSAERRSAPLFASLLHEVHVLGHLAACEFTFVTMRSPDATETFLSLSELDRNASKLAHLELVLFRASAGSFVPPQHYYNTQITVRGKYVSQAVSKAIHAEHYWWYQDNDDRLEGMFGMLRTLEHGTNFDMIQFEERASALMRLEEIYVRRPERRKPSRRISGVYFDHLNPKTIIGKNKDYSPALLSSVQLSTCWVLGASDAATVLMAHGLFDRSACDWAAIAHESPTTDMVRPRGEWVGVEVEPPPPPPRAPTDEETVDLWLNFEDLEDEVVETEMEQGQSSDAPSSGSSARNRQHRLKNFMGHESITVDKAVRLFWSKNERKASERIRRVRGALRAGTTAAATDSPESASEIVAHVDPLRAIVNSSFGVTAVIVMPIKFSSPGSVHSDAILLSDLQSEEVTVTCKVFKPSSATGGESGTLVFKDANFGETVSIAGPLLFPCDPTRSVLDDGRVEWTFPTYSLLVLLALDWDGLPSKYTQSSGRGLLRLIKDESIYIDSTSSGPPSVLMIVDGTEAGEPDRVAIRGAHAAAAAGDVVCELCGDRWPVADMRQHMGAHLLEPSWEHWRKPRPRFPCGLCGIRASIPQKLVDLTSQDGCGVSVSKGSGGSFKPYHQCQLVGEGTVQYSLGSAAKYAIATPCTNRPLKCPKFPFVVWSYSMADHFADKHSGGPMPADLATETALRFHEKEGTMPLLKVYPKSLKRICKGSGCQCKTTANAQP